MNSNKFSFAAAWIAVALLLQVTLALALTPPGSLDALDAHINGDPTAIALQPDGKMIIAGNFTSVQGVPRAKIARLNPDGSLDMAFDPKAGGFVSCVAVQRDGKILMGGEFQTLQPNGAASATPRKFIARLNTDGSLDTAFDPKAGGSGNYVECLAVQADGKILLGGQFGTLQPNGAANPTTRLQIARLNPDGSLDTDFNPKANGPVECIAVQENGQILLGGSFTSLQPNGAAAATARQYVARVNADGSLDAGFDPKANKNVTSLAVQADGKVLIGGMFYTLQPNGAVSAMPRIHIARVNADGSLDTAFNPTARNITSGLVNNGNDAGMVSTIALQADKKILLGGQFLTFQPNGVGPWIDRPYVARLNSDGSLDTDFITGDPTYGTFGAVGAIALQADGEVLLAGGFSSSPFTRDYFERLDNDVATQSLNVPDATQVAWQRGGSSPELSQVTFEKSIDGGANWTALGDATRVGTTSNWHLTGLALPGSGQLRARGRTSAGATNASSGLMETQVNFQVGALPSARPVFTGSTTASGVVGQNFTYTSTYSNDPTFFAARGLHGDLNINSATGVISGAPDAAGTFSIYLDAINSAGASETTVLTLTVTAGSSSGTQYVFRALAGSRSSTGSSDDTGSSARFFQPYGLALDSSGNIYVADEQNDIIRKITGDGVVSTIAGSAGNSGAADGVGATARFYSPAGVAVDNVGNIYVADSFNQSIRKVTSGGSVTTLFGDTRDDNAQVSPDYLLYPRGVAVDNAGNLYVCDSFHNIIRKVTSSGAMTTFAGKKSVSGTSNGTVSDARFNDPRGVAVDLEGNVYVADTLNHTIRKITSGGVVTTLAGNPGMSGTADGTGSTARFYEPEGVAVDSDGNVYVSDTRNGLIRKITSGGVVTTILESPSDDSSYWPAGIAVDSTGNLYFADMDRNTIYVGRPVVIPVFTYTAPSQGTVGKSYSYTPQFSESPTSYNASNLPKGLSIDTTTGVISGTLTDRGVAPDVEDYSIAYRVSIFATNAAGTSVGIVFMTINPEPVAPVFKSATEASGVVGQSFPYKAIFFGTLRSYTVSGLPNGLTFDKATGIISGIPTTVGTYSIALSAQNRNLTATGHGLVELTITPPNAAPTALPLTVGVTEDTPKVIILSGSDPEGGALVYSIVKGPAKGTLVGTAPNLSYKPNGNISGADNFTFRVNDGTMNSLPATVSLTIAAVNDVPVAKSLTVKTTKNKSIATTLAGTDVEGSSLKYSIVKAPSKGTLTGTAPKLTYKPKSNFTGTDSFTYRVNDGKLNSATASVTITTAAKAAAVAAVAAPSRANAGIAPVGDSFTGFLKVAGTPQDESGSLDDPDHDGVNNLLEFLLGGHPMICNPKILPVLFIQSAPSGRNLVFRYERSMAAATEVIQQVEYSRGPSTEWIPAVDGVGGVSIANVPEHDSTEVVTVTIPASSGSCYVRLKATH